MILERPVLVFDGDCGFCTTCVGWMRRHIRRLPSVVPFQSADLEGLGLSAQECSEAVQWVGLDGSHAAAERAVAHALVWAGSGWKVLGVAMGLPGIRSICGLAYRWVARHRLRLPGGTPACALPGRDAGGRQPS